MESIPWYQSAIIRQQIAQIVVALTALLGVNLGGLDVDATLVSIFSGIAAVVAVYTIVTRIFKPSPNLSATAANKEAELIVKGKIPSKEGGFFRPSVAVLAFILGSCAALAVVALPGCAGTKAAYKASASLADTAYVVAEHYAAVVSEAADLAQAPTTPASVKQALQAADRAVKPLIVGDPDTGQPGLQELAARYTAVKNAQTEAELQSAVNAAVLELAKLINAVKAARSH